MVLFNRHATLDFLEDNLDQDTTLRLSKILRFWHFLMVFTTKPGHGNLNSDYFHRFHHDLFHDDL